MNTKERCDYAFQRIAELQTLIYHWQHNEQKLMGLHDPDQKKESTDIERNGES